MADTILVGYQVCRHIKQRQETRELPVVLVSGLSKTEDRLCGLEAGADAVVTKPFTPCDLIARIGSLLDPQAASQ